MNKGAHRPLAMKLCLVPAFLFNSLPAVFGAKCVQLIDTIHLQLYCNCSSSLFIMCNMHFILKLKHSNGTIFIPIMSDILKRCSGLTPGQDDVSERNEVNYKCGHTQCHYGQPAEKRHSPVESTGKRHKSSVRFFAVFRFDVY